MTVVQSLIDLQEVDGRIRELELELKDLPRRKALETARLSGVSADLLAAKANHEYATQRVKGYEADAQALKEKIQELKTTQAGLKTGLLAAAAFPALLFACLLFLHVRRRALAARANPKQLASTVSA